MKITQTPAQKFRWAKRSLSIVLSTAMLLTAVLVPALAALIITPPEGEAVDPIVFIVPETIYMKPVQSGTAAANNNPPEFFMNSHPDGTAIQNPMGLDREEGRFYIQVPDATKYELFLNNASTGLSFTPTNPGDPWNPIVNRTSAFLNDNNKAQGSVEAKEWKLVVDLPGMQKDFYNYTTVYRPVWVPSVHIVDWYRGNVGQHYNNVSWIAGLQKNWVGNRISDTDARKTNGFFTNTNCGATDYGPHGRIAIPNATANDGTLRQLAPLLGPEYVHKPSDGKGGGAWAYIAGNDSTGYKTEATNSASTPGDRTGISSGDFGSNSQNGDMVVHGPETLNTNNSTNWGVLRIDYSRHTNFGSVPNFSIGHMMSYASTGSRVLSANAAAHYKIIGYKRNETDTNQVRDKIRDDASSYLDLSDNGYSTTAAFAETKQSELTKFDVPTDRDYTIFLTSDYTYGVNGSYSDWLYRLVLLRIETPRTNKADLRRRIDAVVRKAGYGTTAYRNALKAAATNLGDPTVGVNTALIVALEAAVAPWPPYVSVQQYQFNDASGINTVTADGTAAPFSTPTVAFTPDAGAVYKTGNYTTTAGGEVALMGAVTAVRDYFAGYLYSGMTIAKKEMGVWQPAVAYPGEATIRRDMVSGDMNVVYIYDPIPYTIKFDGNGGTEVTPGSMGNTPISFNERQTLKPNDFEKTGYAFAGWSTEKNGTKIYNDGDSVINLSANPKENGSTAVTLYACWTPKNDITVILDAAGGTVGMTSKVVQFDAKYGDAEPSPPAPADTNAGLPAPTRTGYTFDGWFDAADKKITAASTVKDANSPQTLTAKWTLKTFDIILDVQGGNPLAAADSKILGVDITASYPALPTPTRDNYEFKGWSTVLADPSLANVVAETDPIGADVFASGRLYAQWAPDEYTVTFDPVGGVLDAAWLFANPTEEITVKFGETYPMLADVDLTLMPADATAFGGWYLDGTQIFAGDPVTAIGNHVLKARWVGILPGVTFIKDGGVFSPVDYDNKEVAAGAAYGTLPVPAKTGYEFKGWYDDAVFSTEVKADTIVPTADPHKIYAKWEAKDFTVTFMPEGGTTSDSLTKTVTFGAAYDADATGLPVVARDGYTFDGWYLTAAGTGTEIDGTTILNDPTLAKDHKLYATWAANSYTVTFDTNGGPAFTPPADEKTVTFGDAYGTLDDAPARMGYVFDGWWTDPVNGTKVRATTPVTDYTNPGHSIYAHWTAIPITVTFKDTVGGNTITPATKKVALATKYGTLPAAPVLDGYVFAGWLSSFNGTLVTKNTLVPDNAVDHDLEAQWVPAEFTVTFDTNGGPLFSDISGDPADDEMTVTFGDPYGALPAPPARTGFSTFLGWSLDGTNVMAAGAAVTETKDHTVIALWDGDTNTVNYDATPGTVTPATDTFKNGTKYGSALAKPDANPGYDFLGWCMLPDFSDDPITEETDVFLTGTTTFYAKWEPKTLKVTFDTQGGTAIDSINVTFGGDYDNLPADPERAGYTFIEWQTEGGAPVDSTTAVTLPTDHKLVAQWEADTITVNFFDDTDYVWDSAADKTRDVTFDGTYEKLADGSTKAMPVPTRGGYAFSGWYSEPDGAGTRVKASSKVTDPTNPQTLYPKWVPSDMKVALYRNYDAADETVKEVAFTFNSEYDEVLVDPERKGYDFKGWYTERTGGTLLSGETASDPTVTKLYAQWTIKTSTVSFNLGYAAAPADEIAPKTVTYGEKYSTAAPGGFPVPTRTGYDFGGWWTSEELIGSAQVTADTVMNNEENHTLYAQWKPATYKITFDTASGLPATIDPKDVTVGKTYGGLPTPTRDGYTFGGWALDTTEIVTASSTVTKLAAHMLTAQWVPAKYVLTFNGNGGTPAQATKTVTYNALYGDASELVGTDWLPATRSGYDFDGWWTDAAAGTQVKESTTVTETKAHTVFAHWTVRTDIKVTLDPNGGTFANPADAEFNDAELDQLYPAGIAKEPEYLGYVFAGWYTKASGGTLVDNTVKVTNGDDHTLYAHWTPKNDIEVTLDSDGGTGAAASFYATFKAAYGKDLKAPTKSGYKFLGWFDTANVLVEAGTIVENPADHTLKAQWEAAEYTLTLNGNGGTPATATKTITFNQVYGALPAPDARTGYNFLGWSSLKDDAALASAVTAATVAVAGNQIIYAQWEAKSVAVELDSNGGDPVAVNTFNATYDAPYGSNLTQVPVRSANKFLGWYDAATGGFKVENISKVKNEAGHKLYAHWASLEFGLYFDPGVAGGTDWSGMFIEDGKPYSYNPDNPDPLNEDNVFPIPTRIGYTFTGWYDAPTGGTEVVITDIVPAGTTAAESMLYAYWDANSYNVKFDANGGTLAADQPVIFDALYGTLPAPTREGYQFAGWFNASGKEITAATKFDTKIMTTPAEHTLTAKWTPRSYTITLDAAGGTLAGTGTISATYDRTYSALPTPTRSGYTFDGWFTPADVKITPADTVKVTADTTLTAKWTLIPPPNTYRLTVVRGTGGGNYLANASVTITADAAPAGQVFAGWVVTAGSATVADTANPNTTLTMANGSVTVEARYRDIAAKKMIFTTKYESKFWNWMMFIFLFGWIWMWFVK